jgi:ferritin-like metal-binding protein YciE
LPDTRFDRALRNWQPLLTLPSKAHRRVRSDLVGTRARTQQLQAPNNCKTEKQIVQALPEMIDKAGDPQLKRGFESHLGETKNQVMRLEQVFKLLGKEPRGVDCPAIDGIIDEAEEVAGEVEDKSVLDAALIAAAQAVEHYEITRYGTLVAWAKELGRNDCAALLQQSLDEEKAVDKKLTAMAESKVNRRAA